MAGLIMGYISLCIIPLVIIAMITIPALLRARGEANESVVVSSFRTITKAEIAYLSSNGGDYGALSDLQSAGLLDHAFPNKDGYVYAINTTGSDYTISAYPTSMNGGRYGYYSVPDCVVRYSSA